MGIGLTFAQLRVGDRTTTCSSDFLNLYTSGKLAFSGHIYSGWAEARVQKEALGCEGYSQLLRLPYYAGMMWPLAQLPFREALVVWRCLCVGAILGLTWLWPGPRWHTFAVCAWSFPMMVALAYGQDVPMILLAAAYGIVLLGRKRDFPAGLCLCLGAAKPHLFVVLILLIVVQRRWRAVLGLAAGGCAIIAGNFLAGGLRWPIDFWNTVTGPWANPHPGNMINLHGLISAFNAPSWLEPVLAVAFLVPIGWACLQAPPLMSFALALAGGVLVGFHSYLYDLVFAIPLLLTVLASPSLPKWLKWAAGIFASPVLYLVPSPTGFPGPVHFLLPGFLVLTSVAVLLKRRQAGLALPALPAEG